MSGFQRYASREALFEGLADTVEGELKAALKHRGSAVLAVPGGTTPAPFFKSLRCRSLDWEKVSVLLTDERFVPEDSDRSNTRLLRESLLQENAAKARLVPFYLPAATPEVVLAEVTQGIEAVLPLDVCVLGMGADMHTASLFPGADLLEQAMAEGAPPVLPMRAAGAPEPRMTLTAPVLRRAASTHVLIAGAEKLEALEKARKDGPEQDAPVRVVLNRELPTMIHYAD